MKMRARTGAAWLIPLVAAIAVVLSGCGEESTQVDFRRVEAPRVEAANASPPQAIRMAVAPVLSAVPTADLYDRLADYLATKLERPVEMVQGKTYAEINDLLKSRDVTLAMVCTNPYLEGSADFGLELLVAPQVDGDVVYYSQLIVNQTNHAESLDDLRGATFAFSDPLSNSGRLAPLYQLALAGETPESFFSRNIFTYSHDSSIRAVADGVVEAAAVDSVVLEYMQSTDPEVVDRVRIVEQWGPFGISPLVVHPAVDPNLKEQLQNILLDMDEDQVGKSILQELMTDEFVVPDEGIYESVREMRSYLAMRGLVP